ncbi:hypothetical protein B5566_02415 [Mycobacterium sp. MHSD3]|nr:hypothetical protein B5566_02415 [Mycobacterium sp. MHSD3]
MAAWAATTQEEWEEGFRQTETDRWGGVLDGLFDGLEQGISFGFAILSAIAKRLLGLDPTTIFESIEDVLEALESVSGLFLGPNSPLNAANLFGVILPGLLTRINVGALTNQPENLLPQPKFLPGSIEPSGEWSVFAGSSKTDDGTGCARVVANGTNHALRSGRTPDDRFPVAANQLFKAEIYVRHSGYTGSGETVRLQVVPFAADGSVMSPVTLDGYTPTVTDLDWPGHKMSGEYQVPEGVAAVQVRVLVKSGALTGTFDFDEGFCGQGQQAGLFQMWWVEGLENALLEAKTTYQLIKDTIVNALTGVSGALRSFDDLFEALRNIPPINVGGVGGPGDIAATVLGFLASLAGGLSGSDTPSSGEGLSIDDVFNLAKLMSVAATQGQNAFQFLSIRNNTPVNSGLLPSGTSNYGLTSANTTLETTQSASLSAVKEVYQDIALGVLSWVGCGTSGMSAFYVNIRKIDPVTGARNLVHHSPNILAELVPGSTPDWIFYQLDTPLDQLAGENYEYEWVPVGGTHYIRGISTEDDIPDHPFAQVVGLAAVRDNSSSPDSPPSSIAKAAVVRSGNIPWFETAIDTGSGIGHYDDVSLYVIDPGTVQIPSWANYVDVSAVGGGGGGAQQGLVFGFHGEPGTPGLYKSVTWQRGTHFDGDTALTFTKGAGGAGGPGDGADGTPSIWAIPGHSITAEPGVGGTEQLQLGINTVGHGPGPYSYKGEPINAGRDQKMPGANGVAPGGGGNGGNGLALQFGGNGADGAGWVRFRQNPVDGEAPIGAPDEIHVVGVASAEACGIPTVTGGLSELPLEDQAAIDAIVAANLTAPGAVLYLESPKGAYHKAYGKVSTAAGARDVVLGDHFRIGSCTKSFTATMILQAVDRGLLALDDPLEKFFPGVPGGDKITIRNMLSLRSGLFNEQADMQMMFRYFLFPTSDWSDQETLAIVKQHQPAFEPGMDWAYVNSNFMILGMIVELVNGRPTRDVLQTDILDPLGLTETSYPTTAKMPEPYANGHAYTTGLLGGWAWQEATETGPGYASWAGSMISTAHDLLLWAKELRDGTLLSPEMHALRTENYWLVPWGNDDQLDFFGYGIGMFELGKWRGHGGSWRGYECSVYYLPNGTLFAMVENAQTPTVEVEVSMMFKIGQHLYPDSLDEFGYRNNIFGVPSGSGCGKPILGPIDVQFDDASAPGVSQYEIPSFTIGQDANLVFACATAKTGVGLSGLSMKCGGVTMNRLPDIANGSDYLAVFWLQDPPPGAQSIKLINAPYGAFYTTGAASYKLASAAGIGTPIVTQGYGATGEVSAVSHAQGRCFNTFFYAGTKSSYSQTERGHLDAVPFGSSGLIFGDAPGGAATFTLGLISPAPWIGIAIPIISNAE